MPDNELDVAHVRRLRRSATDHHELELSLDDPVDLEALTWSLDEPLADLSVARLRGALGADGRARDRGAVGAGSRRASRRL